MPDNGKTRTRNTNGPLTVGQAFDRIRARLATQPERELAHAKEFFLAEAEWHGKLAARVPEAQRGQLAAMLDAAKQSDNVAAINKAAAEMRAQEERTGDGRLDRILNEQPPPAPAAVEINRETGKSERRTGAGRGAG